jgi:peptidoglycan/LPS O-acetylase OafA/YrhL
MAANSDGEALPAEPVSAVYRPEPVSADTYSSQPTHPAAPFLGGARHQISQPASEQMTRANIMIVIGAVMAVGFAAFLLVANQFPNTPEALGWVIFLGVPMISTALIIVGLLTENADRNSN